MAWILTLKEENELLVTDTKVLRKILGPVHRTDDSEKSRLRSAQWTSSPFPGIIKATPLKRGCAIFGGGLSRTGKSGVISFRMPTCNMGCWQKSIVSGRDETYLWPDSQLKFQDHFGINFRDINTINFYWSHSLFYVGSLFFKRHW